MNDLQIHNKDKHEKVLMLILQNDGFCTEVKIHVDLMCSRCPVIAVGISDDCIYRTQELKQKIEQYFKKEMLNII